jgi:hypothetical protein
LIDSDYFNLDFGQLAAETMRISDTLISQSPFEIHNFKECEQKIEYPESSGIVYYLDKSVSTFCLRGIATENISKTFQQIEQDEPKIVSKFKLSLDDSFSKITFFETSSFTNAQIIEKHIINRRFPYLEDMMCNLSDPGFSWWMECGSNYFKIFYKSYGVEREQKLLKLGPIGYSSELKRSIFRFRSTLEKIFPIDEFYGDEKSMCLSICTLSDDNFNLFKDIFIEGRNPFQKEQFDKCDEMRAFYETFTAIAEIRSFWIQIENFLEKKVSLIS